MPGYFIDALFVTVGLMLLLALFRLLRRAVHPVSRSVLHGLAGLAAMLTANTVGGLFGLGLGLNPLTISVCAALGVPGTAMLWAVRYLM